MLSPGGILLGILWPSFRNSLSGPNSVFNPIAVSEDIFNSFTGTRFGRALDNVMAQSVNRENNINIIIYTIGSLIYKI